MVLLTKEQALVSFKGFINSNKTITMLNSVYFCIFTVMIIMSLYSGGEEVRGDKLNLGAVILFVAYMLLGMNYLITKIEFKHLMGTKYYKMFVGGFLVVVLTMSILSVISYEDYRKDPDRKKSRDYAIAASVLGFIYIGVFLIVKFLKR